MYKIKEVEFVDHPILKNLKLDFCGPDGKAVDTVIFAGENGTGKSTIIDALYRFTSNDPPSMRLVLEQDGDNLLTIAITRTSTNSWSTSAINKDGSHTSIPYDELCGIFSDVDINFRSRNLTTVTSLNVDSVSGSRRSETDLPTQIKQLLIDIQALDDASLAHAYRTAKENGKSTEQLSVEDRMSRFTNAFAYVFDGLVYNRIDNDSEKKSIIFQKHGIDIPIDNLSSGEKQIVYRGCFLLKDVNATKGAFVFIDEPEISLHPSWQMRIMEYYKRIFTDARGRQTSQIFAVTHSPFVIHNENRYNDKIIILARDKDGSIIIKDKPGYYKCNSIEAIQHAFSVNFTAPEKPTVYLEGRTDELYFNKTLEVFSLYVPFQFKWIGYFDATGQEANTGKDALNKASAFLISRCLKTKNVCLFDCDTNKSAKDENNLFIRSIPRFDNAKGIRIGIENALVLDEIDIEPFKKQHVEIDGYGIEKKLPDFQKMDCCKYICSLETEQLKKVLVNLKSVIEELSKIFDDNPISDS